MATEIGGAALNDDVPEYYADSLNMTFGPYGFGLEFGVTPFPEFGVVPVTSSDQMRPRPLFRVRVSPHLAQAIKILLSNNIDSYESIFGELKVPEDFLEFTPPNETTGDQA